MGLPAGHRLGPYEVVAPLGAGGMGEVYRARDVRLDRTVAVKILPPELAVDERYRQRFEREARAASALSHPHIAHVYDVGEQEGSAGRPRVPARSSRSSTPLSKKQYVDPVTFADVHSSLGEVDEALRWYEKASEDRTPNMAYASIMPRIDPGLAGNPRYEAIVRRMGFPAVTGTAGGGPPPPR